MPKQRSPDSYKAEKMYEQGMKLVEIASQLNLPEGTVRRWKATYGWGTERSQKNTERSDKQSERSHKKKHGGQPGNKNAVGHGAPKGNKNAEKFGFFSKYLPEETVSIIQEMPEDPLDILWDQIQIAYAAIIRAQKIMYVTDQKDKTVEKVGDGKGKVISQKWEVQQAWDKQANFLQAQARAQKTLDGMINRYEELLHKNWKLATREQKARIQQMKANTEKIRRASDKDEEEDGVTIVNDAPAGENIGDHHSEIPSDF